MCLCMSVRGREKERKRDVCVCVVCVLVYNAHLSVSGHHRHGRVPARHGTREVEGGDDAHLAERVPDLQHGVVLALRGKHLACDVM